jgi:hypothetical protein
MQNKSHTEVTNQSRDKTLNQSMQQFFDEQFLNAGMKIKVPAYIKPSDGLVR